MGLSSRLKTGPVYTKSKCGSISRHAQLKSGPTHALDGLASQVLHFVLIKARKRKHNLGMLVLVSLANLASKTQLTPVQIIFSITPVCVSLVPRLLHSGTRNWSCAGVESLVLFLIWEAPKVERGLRDLNWAWACPRLRTEKERR